MRLRLPVPGFIYELITRFVLRIIPVVVAEALATVFGIWTAIVPLSIWVAWSAEVLLIVLLSAVVSTVLYAIFAIAAAPNKTQSSFTDWTQQRAQYERDRASQRRSSWRDIP